MVHSFSKKNKINQSFKQTKLNIRTNELNRIKLEPI